MPLLWSHHAHIGKLEDDEAPFDPDIANINVNHLQLCIRTGIPHAIIAKETTWCWEHPHTTAPPHQQPPNGMSNKGNMAAVAR